MNHQDLTTGVLKDVKTLLHLQICSKNPAKPKVRMLFNYVDENGNTIKTSVWMKKRPTSRWYESCVITVLRQSQLQMVKSMNWHSQPVNHPVGNVDGEGHLTTTDPTTGVIEGDKQERYWYYKSQEDPNVQHQTLQCHLNSPNTQCHQLNTKHNW